MLFNDPYKCCSREEWFRFVHRRKSYARARTGYLAQNHLQIPKKLCGYAHGAADYEATPPPLGATEGSTKR